MASKIKKGNTLDLSEDEGESQQKIAMRPDGKMGLAPKTKKVKASGDDEIMEVEIEKEAIEAASKANPIARSQQYQEDVKERMRKAKKNQETLSSDEENEDDLAMDDDEEEEDEDDESDLLLETSSEDETPEQQTIEELQEKIRKLSRKAPSTEKAKVGSKAVATKKKVGVLPKPKKTGAQKTPKTASRGIKKAKKRAVSVDLDSDEESVVGVATKKRSRAKKPFDDLLPTTTVKDLAPETSRPPNKAIKGVCMHIGKGVWVKTYPWGDTNFVSIRAVQAGKVDTRRGINFQIDTLPLLKKAVDRAYKDYMTAPEVEED